MRSIRTLLLIGAGLTAGAALAAADPGAPFAGKGPARRANVCCN